MQGGASGPIVWKEGDGPNGRNGWYCTCPDLGPSPLFYCRSKRKLSSFAPNMGPWMQWQCWTRTQHYIWLHLSSHFGMQRFFGYSKRISNIGKSRCPMRTTSKPLLQITIVSLVSRAWSLISRARQNCFKQQGISIDSEVAVLTGVYKLHCHTLLTFRRTYAS